ncbi:hypothetical protein D3C86_1893220 [compost metagenome]
MPRSIGSPPPQLRMEASVVRTKVSSVMDGSPVMPHCHISSSMPRPGSGSSEGSVAVTMFQRCLSRVESPHPAAPWPISVQIGPITDAVAVIFRALVT